MDINNIPQAFLEAVQMRHRLGLKTNDPHPGFRDIIVEPFYIMTYTSRTRYVPDRSWVPDGRSRPEWVSETVEPQPALWCHIQQGNRVPGLETPWVTNRDILLSEIVEWKIMSEEDMTSRTIPQKVYRDFDGHPFRNALVEVDQALRREWFHAAARTDFDPTPFIEKDRRLGEIADEVRGWFEPKKG